MNSSGEIVDRKEINFNRHYQKHRAAESQNEPA
jgi:hypothetical protein